MPAYLTRWQCEAGRTRCTGQSAIGGRHVSLCNYVDERITLVEASLAWTIQMVK